jgi:hypothetical protein
MKYANLSLLLCCFTIASCGGATAEPVSPTPSEPSAEPAPKAEEPAPVEEPAPEPVKEEPKESAKDTLVREGTAFLLNFEKSDVGIKEMETCKKKSKDDVAKEANCFSAAMNKHPREGILFEKKDEQWIYVRFGLEKNVRVDYNRVNIEVAEPSGKQVTIKTVGKDTATRKKGKVPAELVFTVVDEYTIELTDETRGKLIYEPKLGLFASE